MISSYGLCEVMSFGSWLKNKRTAIRLSGAELERLSGVSRQYISNLERELVYERTQNPVQPSVEIVDKLARALGADPDEARLAAGYAPQAPEERHRLPEGVTVYFDSSSPLNDEQKDRILDVINTIVAGVRARE